MILRDYQRAAIDATQAYWATEGGSPLIELATGTGKSVVIATLIRELMTQYPSMRILMLVHVRELVSQNADAIREAWPGAPVGVNCASLKRRDTKHAIVCASVQSVAKNAAALGRRDLIIIDEAHLLPHREEGQYHKLLADMRATTSPDLRLWGCTATPYRLDSGRLDRGENRLFDRIIYTYGIGDGISDKHLAPLISKATETTYDVSSVAKRGGEFIPGALAAAVDQDDITRAAVAEMVAAGKDRRSWLIFATSVTHAQHIAAEVRSYGIGCETVSADTSTKERDAILAAFKAGTLRAIANVGVLTTGFNAPATDLIALMRPTLSPGLLVQMIGRATRNAPGKVNALVLDFSSNLLRHGPVDLIKGIDKDPGKKGEAPAKVCQSCKSINPISARECIDCGAPFDIKESQPKLEKSASTAAVLSTETRPAQWLNVRSMHAYRHVKRGVAGAVPSLRVTYGIGIDAVSEWLCFDHPPGFVKAKAEKWWVDRGGAMPAPQGVDEALSRFPEIPQVAAIRVVQDGQYQRVTGYRASEPAKPGHWGDNVVRMFA